MQRLTVLLFALVAVLGFAVAWVAVRPMPAQVTEAQVRNIVSEALAGEPQPVSDEAVRLLIESALAERVGALPQSQDAIDAATINPMIESYLLTNPEILQRASQALEQEIRTAETAQAKLALAGQTELIYNDPDHIVLGNPNGDVTLVELFDYNCGYCRQTLPDMATLLAEDPNLRVILKEFPILSQESVDAAQIGVLVNEADVDYWQFHQKLFSAAAGGRARCPQRRCRTRPEPRRARARNEVPPGRSDHRKDLRTGAGAQRLRHADLHHRQRIIPGAIGIDGLRQRIANMRACGETTCPPPGAVAPMANTPG